MRVLDSLQVLSPHPLQPLHGVYVQHHGGAGGSSHLPRLPRHRGLGPSRSLSKQLLAIFVTGVEQFRPVLPPTPLRQRSQPQASNQPWSRPQFAVGKEQNDPGKVEICHVNVKSRDAGLLALTRLTCAFSLFQTLFCFPSIE